MGRGGQPIFGSYSLCVLGFFPSSSSYSLILSVSVPFLIPMPLMMTCKVMSKILAKKNFVFICSIGTVNSILKQASYSFMFTTCAWNDTQTTRIGQNAGASHFQLGLADSRLHIIHVVDFVLYKNVKKKSEKKKYETYLHPFTHCEAYFSSSIFTIKISFCGKRFGLYRSFSLTLQVRHAI